MSFNVIMLCVVDSSTLRVGLPPPSRPQITSRHPSMHVATLLYRLIILKKSECQKCLRTHNLYAPPFSNAPLEAVQLIGGGEGWEQTALVLDFLSVNRMMHIASQVCCPTRACAARVK